MQPVLEVQCPFCQARGQIVTPPIGSIIVGPCPSCGELVLLFGGAVLPLDKETVLNGVSDEKKVHLTETIMELVAQRVSELVDNSESTADAEITDVDVEVVGDDAADEDVETVASESEELAEFDEELAEALVHPSMHMDNPETPITDEELRDFLDIDLHLIDQKEYFEKVFGKH